jgi:hypothetical protein
VKLLEGSSCESIVTGIIKGETRLIAAGMPIEQIFGDRKQFKDQVIGAFM